MTAGKAAPILILLMLAAASFLAAESEKTIEIGPAEIHQKSITAFGGNLHIAGTVRESVLLIGGRMIISGTVEKDVMAINAEVLVEKEAVILGDLLVVGGDLQRREGSTVQGEIFYLRSSEDLKKIASGLLPFISEERAFSYMRVAKALLWLIVTLLVLALLPRQMEQAGELIRKSALRTTAVGLLTLLVLLLSALVALVLSLLLIGIPLLLLIMATYLALLAFGRAALYYFVGASLFRAMKIKGNGALFIVCGLLVYFALRFIPLVGTIIVLLVDFLVIGTAITMAGRRFLPGKLNQTA